MGLGFMVRVFSIAQKYILASLLLDSYNRHKDLGKATAQRTPLVAVLGRGFRGSGLMAWIGNCALKGTVVVSNRDHVIRQV